MTSRDWSSKLTTPPATTLDKRSAPSSRLGVATSLIGVVCVTLLLLESLLSTNFSFYLGALAGAFGTAAFLFHGERRITTLGLFNLSSALFVGYAGMVQSDTPMRSIDPEYLSHAIALSIASQMFVNLVAWKFLKQDNDPKINGFLDASTARSTAIAGVVALAAAAAAGGLDVPRGLTYVVEGAAYSGVALIAVAFIFQKRTRLWSFNILVPGLLLALYALFFHSGEGRLRIVALACAIGVLVSLRFPTMHLKPMSVALVPPALWWLARDRLALQESIAAGASAGRTGLESMMSPLVTFAQILEAQAGSWDLRWGSTFVTLPFALVPDQYLPDWVPPALGYDLVNLTDPGRVGSIFSEASTVYGEWVWNFGLLGVFLLVPFVSIGIRVIDRMIVRGATLLISDGYKAVLILAIAAMLSGTIADLVWSGLHTYGTRVITRLPILLIVAFIWHLRSSEKREVLDCSHPPNSLSINHRIKGNGQ